MSTPPVLPPVAPAPAPRVSPFPAPRPAALGAARRMGSQVDGPDAAFGTTRDTFGRMQAKGSSFGGGGRRGRGRAVSALACAVLGFSLPMDPADGPRVARAGQTLVDVSD